MVGENGGKNGVTINKEVLRSYHELSCVNTFVLMFEGYQSRVSENGEETD